MRAVLVARISSLCVSSFVLAAPSASAAPILMNWSSGNPNLVVGAASVFQTIGGITATAQGFTVEFGPGTPVLGPFPTSTGILGRQIFGPETSGIGQSGLGLLTQPTPTIPATVTDVGCALAQPGIDSHFNPCLIGVPSSEFVVFSFSQPVDVSTVVVDDVSNFNRDIWAAAGNAAPDFSGGFFAAFAPFTVVNSYDDSTDGPFSHVLNLNDVSYLVVGATLPDAVGPVGPFDAGGSQFYITDFQVSPVNGNGQNGNGGQNGTAPEPSVLALLTLGGAAVLGRRRYSSRS